MPALISRRAHTYDANGNLLTTEEPSSDITTNTWDYENRLVQVEHPDSSITTYAYDPDNHRVEKDNGVDVVQFLYDGNNVLRETDDVGTVEADFTYVPLSYAQVISQLRDTESSFYLFDGSKNVVQLTDSMAVETDNYVVDAWGKLRSSTGSTANSQIFKGMYLAYYRDADAGPEESIYTTHNRTYVAQCGRFTSTDPAKDDLNYYRYVNNNPVNQEDPSGLQERRNTSELLESVEESSGVALLDFLFGWTGVFDAVSLDIEGNRKRLDNVDTLGHSKGAGNFHVSEGTKATMTGLASYPVIAAMLSPGPEDLVTGPAAEWLAARGLRVVDDAGQWVLKSRAGRVVARGSEDVLAAVRRVAPRHMGLPVDFRARGLVTSADPAFRRVAEFLHDRYGATVSFNRKTSLGEIDEVAGVINLNPNTATWDVFAHEISHVRFSHAMEKWKTSEKLTGFEEQLMETIGYYNTYRKQRALGLKPDKPLFDIGRDFSSEVVFQLLKRTPSQESLDSLQKAVRFYGRDFVEDAVRFDGFGLSNRKQDLVHRLSKLLDSIE